MKLSAIVSATLALTSLLCLQALAQNVAQLRRTIDVDGLEREYVLLVPENTNDAPLPLVFNLHGSGGSPERQLEVSDFQRVVARHGFLAALPQGLYTNTRSSRSWNADLDPDGVDDVALVLAIIDDVHRDYPLDSSRIYSTGFSGGARMTSRLACELSDVLAAVAPVGGIQFGADCDPARPIPLLTLHGKADRVNHYVPTADSAAYWVQGVEESIARWVAADECGANSQTERQVATGVAQWQWSDCAGGAVVEAYIIDDGGHTWPGSPLRLQSQRSGLINQDLDASELIWQFFTQFSR